MSTEKLLKAVVTGPAQKLDEAIRSLVIERQFHTTQAVTDLNFLGRMQSPEAQDPYRPLLDNIVHLISALGLKPAFGEFESKNYQLHETQLYLKKISDKVFRVITHKNSAKSLVDENEELLARLAPFSELGADISELFDQKWSEVRFGSAKRGVFASVSSAAEKDNSVFLFRTGEIEDRIYCVYFALPHAADQVAELFDFLGLQFENNPEAAGLSGIPAVRIKELISESEAARKKAADLKTELTDMARQLEDELLSRYSWLLFMNRAFELRSNAAVKYGKFHLTGWLPQSDCEAFQERVENLGLVCFVQESGALDKSTIPTKLKPGFFSRIFQPFMEMYGYPAYGEVDPRLFVGISYTLLFGIMFGDVGHGALLSLLGLYLAKKKDSWLGRILAVTGLSGMIFGFVYGSVFGNEHLLPGFKVMEGNNMMTILITTVGVGIILIIISMILNIITGIRQHDPKKAYFSPNGLAGTVLFVALLVGLGGDMLLGFELLTPLYIIFLIVLPALCLFCAEPLSKLMRGQKHWLPENWGLFFIEGFFDLFEMFLSFFSNVVSFLRVGAYAICHAGMMMVVYLLSSTADGGYAIWGLVLGNVLVMGIEAVLVFIQVLRLEFYEMFGRFYSGLGFPFKPAKVDYSAAGSNS